MLTNHIRDSIRHIVSHRGYSVMNVLGLAVGLAAAIVIMLWVQQQAGYDRFHEKADRLHRVVLCTEQQDWQGYFTPGLLGPHLTEEFPDVVATSRYRALTDSKLGVEAEGMLADGALVDEAFLDMFSLPFVAGDVSTAFDDPHALVITEETALKLFGSTDVVGQSIMYADGLPLQVTGVIRNIPHNSHLRFDFLASYELAPAWMSTWDNKTVRTYVELHEEADHEVVSAAIAEVYNEHNPDTPTKNYLYLQPVTETHLHDLETVTRGGPSVATYVYAFTAAAIAVLLIACMNFMNLSTALAAARAKEVAVRKMLGSSRRRLVMQFLTESLILALLALLLAVFAIELALPWINRMLDTRLVLDYSGGMVSAMLGITLVTGLLAGSYPALFMSRVKPLLAVRSGDAALAGGAGGRVGRTLTLRRLLVLVQFGLAVFFIVAVTVVRDQVAYTRSKDLGFERDRIVVLPLAGALQQQSTALRNELLADPHVAAVTMTLSPLVGWFESCGIEWDGKDPDNNFDVGLNRVDHTYMEALDMKLSAGRFFAPDDPGDLASAYVVNEAAVRAMGMEDPVGKRLFMPALEREGTIIGVLSDFHSESLHREIRPYALIPSQYFSFAYIRLAEGDLAEGVTSVRETIKSLVPSDPFAYSFLDDRLARLYRTEQLSARALGLLTGLAVFVSCLGLIGLTAYSTQRRTREVGIRKVLGAGVASVVAMISREFVLLVLIASALACPAACWAMDRWLSDFAFRAPVGWDVFAWSIALVLVVALLSVGFHAVRAALTDPSKALRYE